MIMVDSPLGDLPQTAVNGRVFSVTTEPTMSWLSIFLVHFLRGKISPSLLQLPHLHYLDLSFNDFSGTTIPKFIGSLTKLQHLNLSRSLFFGPIPHHIGNLSALRLLDFGGNYDLTSTNLDWLSGSPSLEYLDLSFSNLERCTTWLQAIHKLTSLKELHLSQCKILPTVEPFSVNSSNSLVALDLSFNNFRSSTALLLRFLNMSSSFTYIDFSSNHFDERQIPDAMGNLKSLSYLRLHSSSLNSSNPDVLGNLTSLNHLDLSRNHLQGELTPPSRNSSSLTYLDLSSNKLNGQLPRLLACLPDSTIFLSLSENSLGGSFPNMSRFAVLKELYLGNNVLHGAHLEANLRLPNLEHLDLSRNKFTGRLPNFSSCPSLRVLRLYRNSFNGSLTESFGNLSKIEDLSVGFNQLEGVITEAHLPSLPRLIYLDLSFNLNITVKINHSWICHPLQFRELNLANCKLGPYFPKWLQKQKQNQLEFLDISNSGIIDSIPSWFWGNIHECRNLNMSHNQIYGVLPDLSSKFKRLTSIDLSSNEFTGSLPSLLLVDVWEIYLSNNKFSGMLLPFCNGNHMIIDLSNNLLSGEICQDCFLNLLSSVEHLNLANNNFSGDIPSTNNFSCFVRSLHLRNNSFRGEISRSLMSCSELVILDLGENEFIGKIPVWLGESMPELMVLILKSNMLYGSLPSSMCDLANLQVMDISLNKITGTIPKCVINFTQLREIDSQYYEFFGEGMNSYEHDFYDSASVIWKGNKETYIKNLGLLKMIDLSSNEFTGEIPQKLTSLIGLLGLNLSRNNLVGFIPHDIDQLKLLNFLDLSRNRLSGAIPPTISKLSHLGILDL
ncbi:hypothetical protein C2S51_001835 [Perilla frutescens var. frutescens]|nr:hypothetical protein C2S51_001835 [Perilla frutescens var. frutescens]